MRTPAPVIAALASLAILAACSPAAAPTTAAPLPTVYTCQGGATCSHDQWDQEQAQQKLFVEAETVYRSIFIERTRLYLAGGSLTPSPTLSQLATGEYLTMISSLLQAQAEQRQTRAGEAHLAYVRPLEESREGSVVAVAGCEDGTDVQVTDSSGVSLGTGQAVRTKTWFKREGDRLLAFQGNGEVVSACE